MTPASTLKCKTNAADGSGFLGCGRALTGLFTAYGPKMSEYVELEVTSNFSFLEGGSYPQELIAQAASLGIRDIALTDRNTLAGIVAAHFAAKDHKIRFHAGCKIDLSLSPSTTGETSPLTFSLLTYPTNRESYGRLCRLLSTGKMRASRGRCLLSLEDLLPLSRGLLLIISPARLFPLTLA